MSNDPLAQNVETLKKYSRILVVGPQRSGTNIAAKIIAAEVNSPVFSERQFGESSCVIDAPPTHSKDLEDFLQTEPRYVLQAPVLTHTVHSLDIADAIVCFIQRPFDEIDASRVRSDWPGTERELRKYRASFPEIMSMLPEALLSKIQITVWDELQKAQMKLPFIEIPFSDFKNHPLWVEKKERKSFVIGQTKEVQN